MNSYYSAIFSVLGYRFIMVLTMLNCKLPLFNCLTEIHLIDTLSSTIQGFSVYI